jgi:hypothetical protein
MRASAIDGAKKPVDSRRHSALRLHAQSSKKRVCRLGRHLGSQHCGLKNPCAMCEHSHMHLHRLLVRAGHRQARQTALCVGRGARCGEPRPGGPRLAHLALCRSSQFRQGGCHTCGVGHIGVAQGPGQATRLTGLQGQRHRCRRQVEGALLRCRFAWKQHLQLGACRPHLAPVQGRRAGGQGHRQGQRQADALAA